MPSDSQLLAERCDSPGSCKPQNKYNIFTQLFCLIALIYCKHIYKKFVIFKLKLHYNNSNDFIVNLKPRKKSHFGRFIYAKKKVAYYSQG